jgi:hypothetical protein
MKSIGECNSALLKVCEKYSPKLCYEKEIYKLFVTYQNKQAEVVWPSKLKEIFFDFWDSEGRIFSDSVELYNDGESAANIPGYIGDVLHNFFEHETRLQTSGKLLKIKGLLFKKDDEWQTIF